MARATSKATVRRARVLRSEMSLPEVLLWQHLRSAPVKFRRQHPIGRIVADFYCPAAKLVIEIDGAVHDQRQARDRERDAWLEAQGFEVLRVLASDVMRDPEAVADALVRLCQGPSVSASRRHLPIPEQVRDREDR